MKTGDVCLVPHTDWLWHPLGAKWLHPFCHLYLQEGGVSAKDISYVLDVSGTQKCHHDSATTPYCIPALLSLAVGRREHWKIEKDHAFLT